MINLKTKKTFKELAEHAVKIADATVEDSKMTKQYGELDEFCCMKMNIAVDVGDVTVNGDRIDGNFSRDYGGIDYCPFCGEFLWRLKHPEA